jgi:hypothetical protein
MNLIHIVEGYLNKTLAGTPLRNKAIEMLSRVRMRECTSCQVNMKPCLSATKHCCVCGCDMEAKTRALNAKCPLHKW